MILVQLLVYCVKNIGVSAPYGLKLGYCSRIWRLAEMEAMTFCRQL